MQDEDIYRQAHHIRMEVFFTFIFVADFPADWMESTRMAA